MPSSRRISVSALAAALLDRLQHFTRRGVPVAEHAPLGAGLHDDHRDVVGDHVVQLARDPRPLLDDRLARSHVALALRDLRTPLTVADHAADEQHHHRLRLMANGTAWCTVAFGPGAVARMAATTSANPIAKRRGDVQTVSAYRAQKIAIG